MNYNKIKLIALNYSYNIMVALSNLVNTVIFFGDPDESCSSRIGKSISQNTWASKVPWPSFMKSHFLNSIETDRGSSNAFDRTTRV